MDPQNIPPQLQPVEPVLHKPRQPSLLPLIIGSILFILFVGLGVFYLVMKSIKNPNIVPIISSPITQSVSNIIPTTIPQVETANWKTYSNVDLTFKYPSTYPPIHDGVNQQNSSCNYIELTSNDKVDASQSNNELSLSINICSAKTGETLDSYYQEQISIPIQVSNKQTQIYGGISAIRNQWKNTTGQGNGETVLMIADNKKVTIYKYPLQTSRQQEFEHILSTFVFLDRSRTVTQVLTPIPSPVILYRLLSSNYFHYYTTSEQEMNSKISQYKYTLEGKAIKVFTSPGTGLLPVYRLTKDLSLLLTIMDKEKNDAQMKSGYKYEGIVFYAPSTSSQNTQPVYRLRNSYGDYLYTISLIEKEKAIQAQYVYEGIGFYSQK